MCVLSSGLIFWACHVTNLMPFSYIYANKIQRWLCHCWVHHVLVSLPVHDKKSIPHLPSLYNSFLQDFPLISKQSKPCKSLHKCCPSSDSMEKPVKKIVLIYRQNGERPTLFCIAAPTSSLSHRWGDDSVQRIKIHSSFPDSSLMQVTAIECQWRISEFSDQATLRCES